MSFSCKFIVAGTSLYNNRLLLSASLFIELLIKFTAMVILIQAKVQHGQINYSN